jgi:hypothetical protein
MADEPENLVLTLLRTIRAEQQAMRGDMAQLDAKIDRKFDDLDAKTDSIIKQMIDIGHDVSMLRHAIVPGEMEAASQTCDFKWHRGHSLRQ